MEDRRDSDEQNWSSVYPRPKMWTDKTRKSVKRFAYLLLEDGDQYIQDWIASCRPGLVGPGAQKIVRTTTGIRANNLRYLTFVPLYSCCSFLLQPSQQRKLKGRLRLCARAIFFEPDYIKAPILMFPFSKITKIEQLVEPSPTTSTPTSKWKSRQEGFVLNTSMVIKMKEDGIDAPYVFEKKSSIWWFSLEFAPVQQFLHQAQSLLSINALPFAERDMVLQNAAAQREAKAQFDKSRLVDLSEYVLLDLPAFQVTPLVREPGRLVLTQARIYFQPLHNLNDDNPVRSQPYSEVLAVARRRHSLRPIGLEIFFKIVTESGAAPGGGVAEGASAFFTFRDSNLRDQVVSMLLEQLGGQSGAAAAAGSLLEADSSWLNRVTAAWQARLVSNYDYLMYLNLAAGRSFCDLTQWPIMPWILCDYKSSKLDLTDPSVYRDLSKPIGALNPTRLDVFLERFSQMPQEDYSRAPFLYGTHYSTPGYVLYWLVRAAPAHMLRLQNGRFDSPDRLFVSVAESWESVLNNPADLKELIPEFYAPPSDFLVKREGLNLGIRQNGEPVGDVKLPPWANDPDDFISKNRQALESQHVSMRLHSWIDLIFGYKQRGEAALAANNLYHPLTYEGVVDLDSIDDPVERAGLEAQINEFGQAPRQLFTSPHPSRLLKRTAMVVNSDTLSNYSAKSEGFRGLSMEFVSRIMALASSSSDNVGTVTPLVSASSIKFQIPSDELTTKATLVTPPRKLRSGTPVPAGILKNKAHFMTSDSDTEDSPMGRHHDDEYAESDGRKSEDVSDWRIDSAVSSSGSDFALSEDPFDVVKNVVIQLPSKLRRNSTETRVGHERDNLEDTEPERRYPEAGVVLQNVENVDETMAWHSMFRQRLSEPQCLKLHRSPVNGCVLSEENASGSVTMYSVDKDGFIKCCVRQQVYSISEGFQVRATKLGTLPLSCLALAKSSDAYPTVLAGSYDDFVYVYSVDYGRALSKMRVHDETVSCVRMSSSSSERMLTASWDSTLKLWSIGEGRGSWAAGTAAPEAEFLEHDSAVWSLDVQPEGNFAISGAEDGTILAWDLRNPTSSVWRCSGGGSATGLRLTDDVNQVVAASTDGSLRVLETRRSGAVLASKEFKSSLRCCEIAGDLIIAGSADGSLFFWPHIFPSSGSTSKTTELATEFLDYSPLRDHTDSINCLSLTCHANGRAASFATASNDCSINVYSVGDR
ncbi:uncharacterized protein [Physcomitrium patens]|uniref:uncharacterized protein isoform X2 n=1 Tax=Physcomitrium patens TaxID=3218 RepID=UPI000D156178|nr:BEACH domain-containing protein lvsF-like isoform X1 [Physcomitrium patens]|eukprot:XP_024362547.1 BEACH domain-containing protein lvsF-like isoform X1 [Physcomitrella patens]